MPYALGPFGANASKKKKHDFNKQRGKEQYTFKFFDLVSLTSQGC